MKKILIIKLLFILSILIVALKAIPVYCKQTSNSNIIEISDVSSTETDDDIIILLCSKSSILKSILIIKKVLTIITIITPIVLIIKTAKSLLKTVIYEGQQLLSFKLFIAKFCIAVSIIFVPTIITSCLKLVTDLTNYNSCWLNATEENVQKLLAIEKKKNDSENTNNQNNQPINQSNIGNTIYNILGITEKDIINKNNITSSNLSIEEKAFIAETIHGSEGSTNQCSTSNNGQNDGWIVEYVGDKEAVNYATSYGITSAGLNSVFPCNSMSEESKQAFKNGALQKEECLSKKVIAEAVICQVEASVSYVNNYLNYCNKYGTFSLNEITALVDFAHSGVGYLQQAIITYCNTYNNSKSHNDSAQKMFEQIYKANTNMNVHCPYVARRDCEARIFFNGDYSCINAPSGTNNIYDSSYIYHFPQYLDINNYSFNCPTMPKNN